MPKSKSWPMKTIQKNAFLETKGIFLSTGTISNRSFDFLLLFRQLHINKSHEIKALIERKGCMILHMDGTHRSGGRVVFVLQEGIDNIVINADLIPSEEHIDPVLLDFKNSYSSPLVIVRDMAKRIQNRWIHIAVDHLLYPIEKHVKWIRRPISYFIQYRRIKEVCDLVKRLISCNASNNFVHKPLMELHGFLKYVLEDSRVFDYFCILEKILQWLDELHDNLRIYFRDGM